MTYEELRAALDLFDLDEGATLAEIKQRHRELVKRHHPDHHGGDPADDAVATGDVSGHRQPTAANTDHRNQELIRQINAGYRLILDYIHNYRFSFTREEFYKQNPDQRLRHQFGNDPLWGNGWR
ncbi:J domain-containing protein [Desulfurivibrio dismutans]|uniref:J domain-containing protein n=1 Tax=Desulfurivibrio dismutans TaxID=1398908 RepID=UPI0023DC50E6|nr:J domain-containing protein [Desulfurivibrio alkaliphilus]MDF1613781.1 hypothetical protein [Desulfurivibrio alkaliphilus]